MFKQWLHKTCIYAGGGFLGAAVAKPGFQAAWCGIGLILAFIGYFEMSPPPTLTTRRSK